MNPRFPRRHPLVSEKRCIASWLHVAATVVAVAAAAAPRIPLNHIENCANAHTPGICGPNVKRTPGAPERPRAAAFRIRLGCTSRRPTTHNLVIILTLACGPAAVAAAAAARVRHTHTQDGTGQATSDGFWARVRGDGPPSAYYNMYVCDEKILSVFATRTRPSLSGTISTQRLNAHTHSRAPFAENVGWSFGGWVCV